ncbi:hypothetical protein BDV19DRAFT_245305 [Aspergillus venezuelensis]
MGPVATIIHPSAKRKKSPKRQLHFRTLSFLLFAFRTCRYFRLFSWTLIVGFVAWTTEYRTVASSQACRRRRTNLSVSRQ